jgi:uncharacterized protein
MAAWNRKAAEQGFAEAQYEYGIMFRVGRGIPQDYAQAAFWFRKAAEQGFAKAQYELGFMYHKGGQGVPQDDELASVWLRKAAAQGLASAKSALATLQMEPMESFEELLKLDPKQVKKIEVEK